MRACLRRTVQCTMLVYMHDPDHSLALIGSAEACQLLGINRSTLTRRVSRGELPPVGKLRGTNGAWIFRQADIEAAKAVAR